MKKLFLFPATLVLLAGCGRFGNKERGEKKELRVVCLSKHLTEMMFAIGQGQTGGDT